MNERVISILNDLSSSLFGADSIRRVGLGFWMLSRTRFLKSLVGKPLFLFIYKEGYPDHPSLHRMKVSPT